MVVTLRKISIHVSCVAPAGLISVNNLTTVDVTAIIEDTSFFTELLTNGHYLEILRIQCRLGGRCVPSKAFRNVAPLQALRSFVLNILSVPREFNDPDLFPSVANFVRQHPFLRGLGILKSHEVDPHAPVQGLPLPSLPKTSRKPPRRYSPPLPTILHVSRLLYRKAYQSRQGGKQRSKFQCCRKNVRAAFARVQSLYAR